MRKVLIKRWVQPDAHQAGHWSISFLDKGVFLHWGISSWMNGVTPMQRTIAVVEMPDGTVREVLLNNLKFVEPTVL